MKLNELSDQPGATQNRKRVGRGVGSGTGKTAGRGQKGQKSRGGVALNGFEGGQMPLYMRLPKRGFTKRNRAEFAEINLSNLAAAIEAGKIDPKDVTEDSLVKSGVVRRVKSGVRVLARGEAPKKLNITVTGASKAAVEAIEKAGGKITLTGAKAEAEAGDNA